MTVLVGKVLGGKSVYAGCQRALWAACRSRDLARSEPHPAWRVIWRKDMRDYAMCWRRLASSAPLGSTQEVLVGRGSPLAGRGGRGAFEAPPSAGTAEASGSLCGGVHTADSLAGVKTGTDAAASSGGEVSS